MKNTQKGIWRGILYPAIAFALHAGLLAIMHTGWLSDAGALAITGFIGYVDHMLLPEGTI